MFKYARNRTLEQIIEQGQGKHYSTFSLYGEDELEQALKIFQDKIQKAFQDTNRIEWFDENILLVLKKP